MLSETVNFIRKKLSSFNNTYIEDSEDVINKLFELCQYDDTNIEKEKEILEILPNIYNINKIKEINDTNHNLLTCYISNNTSPSINVITELIRLGIDLEYVSSGYRNADAIMYYMLKRNTILKITKMLSHDDIANSYYSIYGYYKLHNLITAYLANNRNPKMKVINYFENRCVSLTFICQNKYKLNHNALSISLNNSTVPTAIIKKLASDEILRNHTLWDINGNYNILTYYFNKAHMIHLDVLEILLSCGCKSIYGNRLDDYKNNALLIYLHRADIVCKNVIDRLMESKYIGCIPPNTVIYTKERVYNILTWYVKHIDNLNIEIIDHLVSKGVNLHFIDNRSNNIAEISAQTKNVSVELLMYFYKNNIKISEYCLIYYLKSRPPDDYKECIVNYLFGHCKLYYHESWIHVDLDTICIDNMSYVTGSVKNILNTYLPNIEATKLINITTKNYFQLYCSIS